MLDLSDVPREIIVARGEYSTVRSAHEDAMKRLQQLYSQLMNIPARMLKRSQKDDDEETASNAELVAHARTLLDEILSADALAQSLSRQRSELRRKAWP